MFGFFNDTDTLLADEGGVPEIAGEPLVPFLIGLPIFLLARACSKLDAPLSYAPSCARIELGRL